jgi:hypothetical protein
MPLCDSVGANNACTACEASLLNHHTIVFRDMPAVVEWAANMAIEGMQNLFHTQEYSTIEKGQSWQLPT